MMISEYGGLIFPGRARAPAARAGGARLGRAQARGAPAPPARRPSQLPSSGTPPGTSTCAIVTARAPETLAGVSHRTLPRSTPNTGKLHAPRPGRGPQPARLASWAPRLPAGAVSMNRDPAGRATREPGGLLPSGGSRLLLAAASGVAPPPPGSPAESASGPRRPADANAALRESEGLPSRPQVLLRLHLLHVGAAGGFARLVDAPQAVRTARAVPLLPRPALPRGGAGNVIRPGRKPAAARAGTRGPPGTPSCRASPRRSPRPGWRGTCGQ